MEIPPPPRTSYGNGDGPLAAPLDLHAQDPSPVAPLLSDCLRLQASATRMPARSIRAAARCVIRYIASVDGPKRNISVNILPLVMSEN
jgi:hypothetical protein